MINQLITGRPYPAHVWSLVFWPFKMEGPELGFWRFQWPHFFWCTLWWNEHSHGIDGPFIEGLPINSMVIFHGYVSHNQMVFCSWLLRRKSSQFVQPIWWDLDRGWQWRNGTFFQWSSHPQIHHDTSARNLNSKTNILISLLATINHIISVYCILSTRI